MNTLNKNYHSAEVDPDEERINRLIARYNNVHEPSVKREDEYFEINKLCHFSTSPWKNDTSLQTYPMRIDSGYIYKVYDTDDPEEATPSTCNVNIYSEDDSYYNDSKHIDQQTSKDYFCNKSYAEKQTYCRPIRKNMNLVHQVMEKNSKLQLLLSKIVIARQKEKEKDKWDRYVQNLMMKKHAYREQSMQFSSTTPQENKNPLLLEDFSNNNNKMTQSDSYGEILRDLYSDRNELYQEQENTSEHDERHKPATSVYKNQVLCCPSTSGTLQIKKSYNEKAKSKYHYRAYSTPIVVSKENIYRNRTVKLNKAQIKRERDVQTHITFGVNKSLEIPCKDESVAKLQSAQFSEELVAVIDRNETENKDKSKKEFDLRLEESFQQINDKNEPEYKNKSKIEYYDRLVKSFHELEEIQQINSVGDKLETLINLFNNFILEFKPKENLKPKESSNSGLDKVDNEEFKPKENFNPNETSNNVLDKNVNEELKPKEIFNPKESSNSILVKNYNEETLNLPDTSSKLAKKKKKVTIVGNVMTNTSLCGLEALSAPRQFLNSRHEKILYEEVEKNNKLRNEIEAMLNPGAYRPCKLRIHVDVTRERSTEVTNSLSKTQVIKSKERIIENNSVLRNQVVQTRHWSVIEKQCEVRLDPCEAMNADPVGLLAMLRFSTEAIKQMLSFMPNVNRWYLSTEPPISKSHYVCNVCDLTFVRPSQLSAHILGHDLGQVKGGRRKRTVPASTQARSRFKCEFCGQKFSRAYCYEFHRQNCALRLDRPRPRGSSTLVMLK